MCVTFLIKKLSLYINKYTLINQHIVEHSLYFISWLKCCITSQWAECTCTSTFLKTTHHSTVHPSFFWRFFEICYLPWFSLDLWLKHHHLLMQDGTYNIHIHVKQLVVKFNKIFIKHCHVYCHTQFIQKLQTQTSTSLNQTLAPKSIYRLKLWTFKHPFFNDKNLPNGVGLNPDVGVAKWTLGLSVCLTGLPRVTVVFDRLVHCHVVRQESLTHEELQLVSGCSLTDEHSSL